MNIPVLVTLGVAVLLSLCLQAMAGQLYARARIRQAQTLQRAQTTVERSPARAVRAVSAAIAQSAKAAASWSKLTALTWVLVMVSSFMLVGSLTQSLVSVVPLLFVAVATFVTVRARINLAKALTDAEL